MHFRVEGFKEKHEHVKHVCNMQVPGCLPSSTCKIGATLDGEYICVGSSRGTAYIYEAATGSLVKQFTPPKVESRLNISQLHSALDILASSSSRFPSAEPANL